MAQRGRPKGLPKSGGRQKGVPAKKEQISHEVMQALFHSVPLKIQASIKKLEELTTEQKTPDPYLRFAMIKELNSTLLSLMPYLHAKRAPVSVSEPDPDLAELEQMNDQELAEFVVNGVQEIALRKGYDFVKVDGTTLPKKKD